MKCRTHRIVVAAVVASIAALAGLTPGAAATAITRDLINGNGSSWAALAVQQWITDTTKQGLKVVYSDPGSGVGRQSFAQSTVDFSVSDIGYLGEDPVTHQLDVSNRKYAYLPIVGGGTAFPYNLTVAGKRVDNLRLSGETIAKIFTGKITNWNDAQIKADNNGRAFPSIPIVTVVHSESAGSTAQFSRYLAQMFPSLWAPFNNNNPSGVEYYPKTNSGIQKRADRSDGVMNIITGGAGQGTIGYNEYAYALAAGIPAVKVKNAAGYYVLPTQYNDAVALTKANINMDKTSKDYLLQDLSKVYTDTDSRTYPLSSYSYGIIPTAPDDDSMTTGKRQTMADFLTYAVCGGQAHIGDIGYTSLPVNLVKASMDQIALLKAADPAVSWNNVGVQKCGKDNPTFDGTHLNVNLLAQRAPRPEACDKEGAGPCGFGGSGIGIPGHGAPGGGNNAGGNGGGNNAGGNGGGNNAGNNAGGNGGGTGNGGSTPNGGSNPTAVTSGAPSASGGAQPVSTTDALGNPVSTGGGGGDTTGDGQSVNAQAVALPVDLARNQDQGSDVPYAVAAVVILLLIIVAPPLFVTYLRSQS